MSEVKKSKLTLQINNCEALERLIGGDAEIEVELRQSAADAFVKKYMKSLVNDTMLKNAGVAIKNEMEKEFLINNGSSWAPQWILSPKVRSVLEDYMNTTARKELIEIVQARLEVTRIKEEVDKILNIQADYIAGQLTDAYLQKRLDMMVNERLKKSLGING